MASSANENRNHPQDEHRKLIAGRRRARRLAMQALYAMTMSDRTASEVLAEFSNYPDFAKADTAYFRRLIMGVERDRVELDAALLPFLDRAITALTPVELSILRMAAFELHHQIDVPYKVIINEAVNLASKFGADQSFKYINGVLDKSARQLRSQEQPSQPSQQTQLA